MHKAQVEKFYESLWNAHNKDDMASLLHEDFTFRGSLGQEKRGCKGFSEYVDMVHGALENYLCNIEDLVAEGDKVFARMIFTGIHRGKFLGYQPTGQRISWYGCALFNFEDGHIIDVWVLGDLKNLEEQLKSNAA